MIESKNVESRWQGLCKMGGVAAFLIALLLLGEIVVYAVILPRNTAVEFIALFRDNWFAGLFHFDLLGMISYLLYIPLILALYVSLRRTSESVMAVATVLFFIGIAVFFATNTAFSMLSISKQYTEATTEAEKAMFLAACQAMITLFKVNAFMVSYIIVSASWILIAGVMLKSKLFSLLTSWSGILAGASGIIAEIIENTYKPLLAVAIAFYFAAIVFLFVWVIMTGRKLRKLGDGVGKSL